MPIYKTEEKRDGLFKYRVVINYTDQRGKYKSAERAVYGSAEAKQLEAKLKAEYTDAPASGRITLDELYAEYLKSKKNNVRETTYQRTEEIYKLAIKPYLGTVKIEKLNAPTLQDWENKISDLDRTVRTRKNYYAHFRALLNFAVKMHYLTFNPLTEIGNFKEPLFTEPQEKLQYYTVDQFIKYITVAKEMSVNFIEWAYYVFFNIAFYTGMRKGEINALKWSDIDNDILHVRRSVTLKLKTGPVETPPKNKPSYRDLQIPEPLMIILSDHKNRQKQLDGYSDNNRVCGGIGFLPDTTIDHKNRLFAEKAEVPRIRIHDFRHTHASLLCNEGINIQEIARRLGHSKIEMTWNTYSHLYPREEERALKVLNNIKI